MPFSHWFSKSLTWAKFMKIFLSKLSISNCGVSFNVTCGFTLLNQLSLTSKLNTHRIKDNIFLIVTRTRDLRVTLRIGPATFNMNLKSTVPLIMKWCYVTCPKNKVLKRINFIMLRAENWNEQKKINFSLRKINSFLIGQILKCWPLRNRLILLRWEKEFNQFGY